MICLHATSSWCYLLERASKLFASCMREGRAASAARNAHVTSNDQQLYVPAVGAICEAQLLHVHPRRLLRRAGPQRSASPPRRAQCGHTSYGRLGAGGAGRTVDGAGSQAAHAPSMGEEARAGAVGTRAPRPWPAGPAPPPPLDRSSTLLHSALSEPIEPHLFGVCSYGLHRHLLRECPMWPLGSAVGAKARV